MSGLAASQVSMQRCGKEGQPVIFEGNVLLKAEAATVWAFLLDMNQMAACIPGLQSVAAIDQDTFEGTIVAAVGPVSGNFSFRAHLVERKPPDELLAALNGTDSVTKSKVNGETVIRLNSLNHGRTELSYRSTVDIQGRLAILGEMVLRATGNLMLRETAQRLKRRVEGAEVA